MTTPLERWQDWITGGGGTGDPAQNVPDIQVSVESFLSQIGTLHADLSDVPASASIRPNGVFSDPNDLMAYLDGGALLFLDEDLNPFPNPIVHIVREFDPDDDSEIYRVYVDENS